MRKHTWTELYDFMVPYTDEVIVGHEFRYEKDGNELYIKKQVKRDTEIHLVVGDRETWFKGDEADALIEYMLFYYDLQARQ